MSSVLVHSNNTSLLQIPLLERNEYYFNIPDDYDIDEYLANTVLKELSVKKPDAIFIKYALSDNYLEFFGLRLACHIRLCIEDPELMNKPIILVGEERPIEILKLSDYSDILSTSGIYFIKENLNQAKSILKKIEENKLKGLQDYHEFINRVNIKAPSNYDTRHSLVNDLSIYSWAQFIGCENEINNIQKNILENLYFRLKILKSGFSFSHNKLDTLPKYCRKSEIVLIDDEVDKGWGVFYRHLFSDSQKINLRCISTSDFKNQNKIIDLCMDQINDTDLPDVVLLDLRLTEGDINENNPEKLTGYKILSEIKKINEGIQVIITTASNKSLTFKKLINNGANDFIIKDVEPGESIVNLINSIESCLDLSKVLVPFQKTIQKVSSIVKEGELDKVTTYRVDDQDRYDYMIEDVLYYLELSSEIISNGKVKNRFSLSVLQLYKALEVLTDYYLDVEQKSKKYKTKEGEDLKEFDFRKSYSPRPNSSHLNGAQLIYNVYYLHNHNVNKRIFKGIYELFDYRNSFVHHTDLEKFDQLEELYLLDDKTIFERKFFKLHNAVEEFFCEIVN